MISRIIAWCFHHRTATILAVLFATLAGALAAWRVPLDAIPDLADTQVIVTGEWPGQAPELVASRITTPVMAAVRGLPGVRYVRGLSMPGDALVYIVFRDGVSSELGRRRALELLGTLSSRLPEAASLRLGPDATSVGWILEYALIDTTGTHDLADLRAYQDQYLGPRLQGVEGVAEVASIGGYVRQFQVQLDPVRLGALGLGANDVVSTVTGGSRSVGAGVVEISGVEHTIVAKSTYANVNELSTLPISGSAAGAIVRLQDVADVSIAPAPRRGIAELDGRGEVVGGIVIMRQHENAKQVLDRVHARLRELEPAMPSGMRLVVTYDRLPLIEQSVATLWRDVLIEVGIVGLVALLFLANLRSALVAALSLPVAVLMAFGPMYFLGVSADIMSLGGIAIAIGAMVDAAMILSENVLKRLEGVEVRSGPERNAVTLAALQEVGRPVFFALLVLAASFLPVFALEGAEGRLFRPLAITKTLAMACAALLAVTLTPALMSWSVRKRTRSESELSLSRSLQRAYEPVVRYSVRHRKLVIALGIALVVGTIPVYLSLGHEFMPPLDEGSILYMPTSPPGLGERGAARILQSQDRLLREMPEVERVFGKIGRADTATDPAPLTMAETVIQLKPRRQWRRGITRERIVAELDSRLRVPGMANTWWMPIQTRNEMNFTGVRSAVAVKVFAASPEAAESVAVVVEGALRRLPGVRGAYADRLQRAPGLDLVIRRDEAVRLGLDLAEVQELLATLIGGEPVAHVATGRESRAVTVRLTNSVESDLEPILQTPLRTSTGRIVRLADVVDVEHVDRAAMVQEEDGWSAGLVTVEVEGVSAVDFVRRARGVIQREVQLPAGVRIEWAGQYQAFERARARLLWIIPAALVIICLLLYASLRSLGAVAIVLLAIPFSLVGAVIILAVLGYQMSVAVWIGMVALAGLDAETGTLMLLYLRMSVAERQRIGRLGDWAALTEAIVEGAAHRIRPKIMTVMAIVLGLMPLLIEQGVGSEPVQRIAAPMAGGVVTSFILELVIYPAVFAIWQGRGLKALSVDD